jgi:hypothetical protein
MADNDFTKKEKIEVCLKLAEAAWRDYSDRRAIEWKVNFGLWAGLGAFAGFVFQRQGCVNWMYTIMVCGLIISLLFVYACLWKKEIQKRNKLDVDAARLYWREAHTAISVGPLPEVYSAIHDSTGQDQSALPDKNQKWRPTHLSQLYVTVAFAALAAISVLAKKC